MQFPKLSVFILALIVFDFYSFEGSKNTFYRKGKCVYIYIYNYIYICIYCVLLGRFDAINASNQRTICSCMIFQPSCCILYIIFSNNSIVFYEIFYNDVTASLCRHVFFTDPDEICTAYVNLNSKHILFVKIF